MNDKAPNLPENSVVMLPCTQEHFAEFISGLLGQPQEITRAIRGSFTVGRREIEQVHHLIMQRTQQNNADLVQFSSRIGFEDGSSVFVNSFSDFQTYHEVRNVVSERIELTWTFLIHFPGKPAPEKQEIDIAFVASLEGLDAKYGDERPSKRTAKEGLIHYRIGHTSRTWGGDIESLLDSYIRGQLQPESRLRQYVRRYSDRIGLLVGGLIAGVSLSVLEWIQGRLIGLHMQAIAPILGGTVPIAEKIDYFIKIFSEGSLIRLHNSSSAATAVVVVLCVAVGLVASLYAGSCKPSFVLFSEKADREKVVALRRYERHWRKFIGSILVGIAIGIAGNFAYDIYWKEKLTKIVQSVEGRISPNSTKN